MPKVRDESSQSKQHSTGVCFYKETESALKVKRQEDTSIINWDRMTAAIGVVI